MQPYPSELKEVILERVLSGEISRNAPSQTDKLGFAAVRKWRDNALTFSMPASLAPYYGLGKLTLQTQKVDCRCALILGGLTETFSALSSENIYPQRTRQNAPSCSRFFTQVHAPHDASQMRVAWFSRKINDSIPFHQERSGIYDFDAVFEDFKQSGSV